MLATTGHDVESFWSFYSTEFPLSVVGHGYLLVMPHFYWPEFMITEHDIYTHIQAAFPDVDAEQMQKLVATYIRLVYKKFKSNENYTWTDAKTIPWVPLRTRCGVFVSRGQIHNVLDSFHQVFPLMAIVRVNSNFGNYSVNAIMYYPHIAQKCFNKCCLLGMEDPICYRMRDRLMQLYDSRRLPEPAVRVGPNQLRRLTSACALPD